MGIDQGPSRASSTESAADTISHNLTKMENTMYFSYPPIHTLTWFKGDFQAAKFKLKERLMLMIAKNPWLIGRISVASCFPVVKCHLSYTPTKDDDFNITDYFTIIDPTDSPLSYDIPIGQINDHMNKSFTCIKNGPKEPIFKFTIIPCSKNPQEAFALSFQLSHVAGDGAVYYKLLHMLCSTSDDTIVELNPERIEKSDALQQEAMNKAEFDFPTSLGVILVALSGVAMNSFKGSIPYDCHFVDPIKMKEAKEASVKDDGLPFVSTNDVLTSWFMKQAESPYGLMAINWRNRLEGHTDLHAGNYENVIFYNEKDYESPGLIRKSLDSCKRFVTKEEKLPSWWEMARSSIAIVTNWTSFAKPNEIEGCDEHLHVPIISFDDAGTHKMPLLVIFRAGEGKIGLCCPQNVPVGEDAPFVLTE
mmetsp:Transcript_2163/g.2505  ORF Transcript_2163/g.2505 Transcript_2163/m.2505 type:complete len:420 (+) Transcript_2163:83-1342(+)|eukprot:CAMPEP_0204637780 /NCGR_PEP_ID=MMETSP0717-20131115/37503_1 /ASSEMBLY_ACC=CAM_ASM_000666 /TAXON_ID=230516 /ORGANISM="Chaetoceros curvisetus" /LENGTH=419 /DNA_ID=CAMNT_0051657295 /DNA_START=27 /DNA_END=1286 /DNA_ORIENTATION=+